jgi:hypothetical protein
MNMKTKVNSFCLSPTAAAVQNGYGYARIMLYNFI